MKLVRVCAPHFVSGFETDGTVRRAAPIIKYMVGWPDDKARKYIAAKKWQASIIPARQQAGHSFEGQHVFALSVSRADK